MKWRLLKALLRTWRDSTIASKVCPFPGGHMHQDKTQDPIKHEASTGVSSPVGSMWSSQRLARRVPSKCNNSKGLLRYYTSRTGPSPPHTISDTSGHLLENTSPSNDHSAKRGKCLLSTTDTLAAEMTALTDETLMKNSRPPALRPRQPITGHKVAGWSCCSGHGETPGLELAQNPV